MGRMKAIPLILLCAAMAAGCVVTKRVDNGSGDFRHGDAGLTVGVVLNSMTPQERSNPKLLNPQRKFRIAKGSGCDIATVNRFIKQFNQMQKMMKQMGGMGGRRRGRNPFGGLMGGGMPGRRGGFPF